MDLLDAMRAFTQVAEGGSFSAASQRLNLSKSAVSRLVSGLEAELGVRLLQRTTRSLALTEAGRAYLERSRAILSEIEDAHLAISHHQAEPTGRLRVTTPVSFATHHLSPILPAFLDRHPRLSLDMAPTDRFVDLVEEGFDLAIRVGRLAESSLIARRLAPSRRFVCASPAYLARHGTPATPADLGHHDCLSHGDLGAGEWGFVDARGRSFGVEVTGRVRAGSGDLLRELALAGVGVAYLPTFFIGPDIREGRLVPLLTGFTSQDAAVHAVWPAGRHLSPKVRAFVDFLAERIGPEPYWDEGIG
ncbi:MAG: LysR family transcriptional regulator [Magnetospirillum sp.]|nr:LysR family transcriptional regulator [Magnetospirillum sp.]